MHVRSILVPTDFSPCAQAALSQALFLARHFDANLHLLHVLVPFDTDPEALAEAYPDIDEIYRCLREIAGKALKQFSDAQPTHALRIREVLRHSVAATPAILEYAAENDIDLIVIGTHGRRGLRRFLLGSVAEETVRLATCPVWTVRQQSAEARVDAIRRIMVPYDFSEDATKSLEHAKDLAIDLGARIEVVHAVPPPQVPAGAGVPLLVPPSYYEASDAAIATLTQRLAGLTDPMVAVEPTVIQGPPARAIVDHAKASGADLIVIGSHGLTGARRFLLGSVSERVVRAAECPVLVLRHGEAASETNDAESGE